MQPHDSFSAQLLSKCNTIDLPMHSLSHSIRKHSPFLDTEGAAIHPHGASKEKDTSSILSDVTDVTVSVYRYKFSKRFADQLFAFSKVHEYDDLETFKKAWDTWKEDNEDMIDIEIRRLESLGYVGDISNKIFKSARYYFRKKETQKKKPAQRRDYIGLRKEMLHAMDVFIRNNLDLKPSLGFETFCKQHRQLLKEELVQLYKANITDPVDMKNKIKKTYKNRYFLFSKNIVKKV
jgi:hypothetical protein